MKSTRLARPRTSSAGRPNLPTSPVWCASCCHRKPDSSPARTCWSTAAHCWSAPGTEPRPMTDTFYRVATDTGGTFTDFVVFDEHTNDYSIMKVPSTPDDPIAGRGRGPGDVAHQGNSTRTHPRLHARHDRGHQRIARRARCPHRPGRDRGLSRHLRGDGAEQTVRPRRVRPRVQQADDARRAVAHRRGGGTGDFHRRRAASAGRRVDPAGDHRAGGGRCAGGRNLLPVLVHESGSRTQARRCAAAGASRMVRDDVKRTASKTARVLQVEHHGDQCVRLAGAGQICRPPVGGTRRSRDRPRAPVHHAVQRRLSTVREDC